MYKQLSRWFVATLIVSVSQASVQTSVQESVARSVKDVRVLSPEWICVVVDPTEEILAERQERFGAELAADQERFLSGKDTWYFAFSKGFRTLLVQQSYHLPLFAKFNQAGYWKVNGVTPTDVTVWSHSVDGFPGWSAADAPTCDTRNESRTTDMVYLKLPSALRSGEQIEVKGEDGRAGVLTFNDESTVCWNQGSRSPGFVQGQSAAWGAPASGVRALERRFHTWRDSVPPRVPSTPNSRRLRCYQLGVPEQAAEVFLAGVKARAVLAGGVGHGFVAHLEPFQPDDADEFIAPFPKLALAQLHG
jgi:hypothetical protein